MFRSGMSQFPLFYYQNASRDPPPKGFGRIIQTSPPGRCPARRCVVLDPPRVHNGTRTAQGA